MQLQTVISVKKGGAGTGSVDDFVAVITEDGGTCAVRLHDGPGGYPSYKCSSGLRPGHPEKDFGTSSNDFWAGM